MINVLIKIQKVTYVIVKRRNKKLSGGLTVYLKQERSVWQLREITV